VTKSRLILAIGLVLLPVFTIIGVGATEFTAVTTQINYIGEIVETDPALEISEARISIAKSYASQDDTSSPVDLEPGLSYSTVNVTGITRGHIVYTVTIREQSNNSASDSTVKWNVSLYLNETQIGPTVQLKNNPTNDSTVEGVTLRWDLGVTSLGGGPEPDLIEVVVKRAS